VTSTASTSAKGLILSSPVKLVIWDLDDTFWDGTISEGPVKPLPANQELVKELNRRGIVNSICSKNDYAVARAQLEVDADWDQFVFASIDWTPKGPRIAKTIADMGLRPVNVLFVDDNIMNLREAEHFSPGIQVIEPTALRRILELDQLRGKDDTALTRLSQYRILETKVVDRQSTGASNEEFLRSSEIRVGMHKDSAEHIDRILELVNRSNQLNYTKDRFERSEFEAMLSDSSVSTGYVTVRDKYGDYGICGFYCHSAERILNLTFSCRILNMGVENWVYQQLGALPISISGDVATALDAGLVIDWVTADDSASPMNAPDATSMGRPGSRNVLMKGGCDLSVVADHMDGAIDSEFTFPSATGALVHQEHTEILRRATSEVIAEYGDVIDRIPFLERHAYSSRVLDKPEEFDAIVYSVLMDYTQGLYRYRDTDFVVPFGEWTMDVTKPDHRDTYIAKLSKVGLDRAFFDWFGENFTFEGQLTPQMIAHNIKWLRKQIPESVRLVLLNGAEVPSPSPLEPESHLHHAACNQALEQAVVDMPNTSICDVRLIITQRDDLTNNIRHYSRRAYFELARQLTEELSVEGIRSRNWLVLKTQQIAKGVRLAVRRVAGAALRRLR
jgi:FkbH-like protein